MSIYSPYFYQPLQENYGGGDDPYALNEDLKTFGHNLWTRGIGLGSHAFNLKRIPLTGIKFLSNIFNGTDKVDQEYFKSMYTMTSKVTNRLLGIIKAKYKDAVVVGQNNVKGSSNSHIFDFNDKEGGLASRHTRQATAGFGGITTTATCFYKLHCSGGYYIIYFTFDGKGIRNCSVLCKKPNTSPEDYDSYYVQQIPEFHQIPEADYTKN